MYSQGNQMNQINQQGAFNAPQEISQPKPSIVFDEEVKEILNKSYNEMINGMINLAIKRFAETKEFKEYFVRKEFRETIEVKEEELEENSDNFNKTQTTSIPSTQTVQTTPAGSAVSAW